MKCGQSCNDSLRLSHSSSIFADLARSLHVFIVDDQVQLSVTNQPLRLVLVVPSWLAARRLQAAPLLRQPVLCPQQRVSWICWCAQSREVERVRSTVSDGPK